MPRVPVAQPPLGMLQLTIKSVDLEQGSDSCFCLLRCGPLWGRSTTQPSSNHLDFSWEVCPGCEPLAQDVNNLIPLPLDHLLSSTLLRLRRAPLLYETAATPPACMNLLYGHLHSICTKCYQL